MASPEHEEAVRKRAYEIWEREGRPDGRDAEHWRRAAAEQPAPTPEQQFAADQEAILERRPVDYPAVLTRDVPGG